MTPVRVGVINADGSNTKRGAQINKFDKLADELTSVINAKMFKTDQHGCFLTVTEICKKASCRLYTQLPDHIDFDNDTFTSKDSLAWYWDADSWKPCEYRNDDDGRYLIHFSNVGKYAAVKLYNEQANKRLLYVSVHLPSKKESDKSASYRALKKLIEDSQQMEVDGVIIAGDFNMPPTKLRHTFSEFGLRMGIEDDKQVTTEAGSSIDNVVTTDSVIHQNVEVCKTYNKLTHYPLFAQLTLED